jgi:hypothetical protein
MEMVSLDEAIKLKFIDRNSKIVRARCAVAATLGTPHEAKIVGGSATPVLGGAVGLVVPAEA